MTAIDTHQSQATDQDVYFKYKDVMENPIVRAVGGWRCKNHDAAFDEAAYVAKADIKSFSKAIDEALDLL